MTSVFDRVNAEHQRQITAEEREAAELKAQAAEDWDCREDELVRCERCPVYDEVCDFCGETKWVFEN